MAAQDDSESAEPAEKRLAPVAIDPSSITFGIDLTAAAGRMARFLRSVDRATPSLFDQKVVANALRRYEQCWMPLKADRRQDDGLVPPLDVRWLWHCHMLRPLAYRADCDTALGTGGLVDSRLLSAEEMQSGYAHSVEVWQSAYPDEPYDYAASARLHASKGGNNGDYERRSSYDIAAAVQRQRNFNYTVSLPHYSSPMYLEDTVEGYRRYLSLLVTYMGTDERFSPGTANDLIWHTHQVHPAVYAKDTIAIAGAVIDHNDNMSEGEKSSRASSASRLWTRHFGEPLWRRGAMTKGHRAPGLLDFIRWSEGKGSDSELNLSLSAGEFADVPLRSGTELHHLCVMGALCPLSLGQTVSVATHRLDDKTSGTQFTVRVVHSLGGLLSMVLVYGGEGTGALLAAAHLAGPDALPSADQLDEFSGRSVPHMSEPHERAVLAFDKRGDFAVAKASWRPLKCEQAAAGAAGNLHVQLFDLILPKVHTFNFHRLMYIGLIGDDRVDFASGTVRLARAAGSARAAHHVAAAFAVAMLYALCEPPDGADHAKGQWALVAAAAGGKGRAPSNTAVYDRLCEHMERGGEGDPAQWLAAGCGPRQ